MSPRGPPAPGSDTDGRPRVLIFSGKGGVGKTTLAAATGLHCARRGLRTIVLSVDVAHSLADAFDITERLHTHPRGTPFTVEENLEVQEIDVQEEVSRHWREMHSYLSLLFSETGMNAVLAEDLAIIPGMEDVAALLYLNEYIKAGEHDVIVLDLAPTGESLRFVSMPDTLDWYMRHVFKFERRLTRAVRPIAKRMRRVPLPEDSYFQEMQLLLERMEGVDKVLADPSVTSVRLVTNPERMVVKETQRAHLYFSLHGVVVDEILVNRVLPPPAEGEATPGFLRNWYKTQRENLDVIRRSFADLDIHEVPLMDDEVVGVERLARLAERLYGSGEDGRDPRAIKNRDPRYRIEESGGETHLKVRLPHLDKRDLDVWVEAEELILRIGSQKHHYPLPQRLSRSAPSAARHADGWLTVAFPRDGADASDPEAEPIHLRPEDPGPQRAQRETDKPREQEAVQRHDP